MSHTFLKLALGAVVTLTLPLLINAQRASDRCESISVQLTDPDGADFTLADINKNPGCFENALVRLRAIYRVGFENSDLYDPVDITARAWLDLDKFYPAIKRCGDASALSTITRKNGGTFGTVALGILKTSSHYGHMGGWNREFQVICIEKAVLLSKSWAVFGSQPSNTQSKIVDWYKAEITKLY